MTGTRWLRMMFSLLLIEVLPLASGENEEEVIELFPKTLTHYTYFKTNPPSTVSPDGRYVTIETSEEKRKLSLISVEDLKRGLNFTVIDEDLDQHTFEWLISVPHTIYLQERDKGVVWLIDAATKQKQLAYNGTDFTFQWQSYLYKMVIAVGVSNPNTSKRDIYHLNLMTGQMTLVYENPRFTAFVYDKELRPRVGRIYNDEINTYDAYRLYNNASDKFSSPMFQLEDLVHPAPEYKFVDSSSNLWLIHRQLDITGRMVRFDLETRRWAITGPYQEYCEPKEFLIHPEFEEVLYYLTDCQMPIGYVSETLEYNFNKCTKYFHLNTTRMKLESLSLYSGKVVMALDGPTETPCTFLCDLEAHDAHNSLTLIRCMERELHDVYDLQPVYNLTVIVEYAYEETCYYSLPLESDPYHIGVPDKPLPWVIEIHGGPYGRYDYGLDRDQKFYTSRGYACMVCNFRGSGGYGYHFDASTGIGWDTKMRSDIVLPVKEILERKWADPQRVCLLGGSYGGYQVLLNAVREDRGLFVCFIDLFGPSHLPNQFQDMGPADSYYRRYYAARMNLNVTTPENNQTLWEQSPARELDNIDKPILIIHGAQDPAVRKYQSDIVVSSLRQRNKSHIYMVFPDEGHGIGHLPSHLAYLSVLDQFLHKYLGGRMETVGPESYIGAKFYYSQLHFDDIYVTGYTSNATCDPPFCD